MRKENRQKVVNETVFVSEDGKEFGSERDAMRYEWELKATTVYAIMYRGHRGPGFGGSYGREINEIYSKREFAEQAISSNHNERYYIEEIFIDAGLLARIL